MIRIFRRKKNSKEVARAYQEQNHTRAYEGYAGADKGLLPDQKRDDVLVDEAPVDDNLLKLVETKGFDPDMPLEERIKLSKKKDDEIYRKAKKQAKKLGVDK